MRIWTRGGVVAFREEAGCSGVFILLTQRVG
jgi:hypothetical protein